MDSWSGYTEQRARLARPRPGAAAPTARVRRPGRHTRADAAPTDVDAQLAAADLSFASNDIPAALDRLLAAVTAVDGDERDRVRQRLIEFFDLLGPDDPRVPPARRALTRALF